MQIGTSIFDAARTRYDAAKNPPNPLDSAKTPTFARALNAPPSTSDSDLTRVRKAAGDLLAHALILPVLKQLRRSALSKNTFLAPGTGEKTFGPEFDMHIAERLAQSPKLQGLAHSVADGYLRRLKGTAAGSKMDVHG